MPWANSAPILTGCRTGATVTAAGRPARRRPSGRGGRCGRGWPSDAVAALGRGRGRRLPDPRRGRAARRPRAARRAVRRRADVDALFERALRIALAAAADAARGAAPAGPPPGDRPRLVPAHPDAGLRLLRRPVLRHARRAARAGWTTSPSSAPPTCTSCRCCGRARARTTAATPSRTTARSTPGWARWTDLEDVAGALHERGMSLCIDLVLNHTAREHPWAQGWLAGDPAYAGFYTAFPDRTMPDAYDATIPEVFPDRAPGSFSWVPEACGGAGGWVWTTFWPYQWDLDYTNPAVTLAMLGEITWLANRGVDVFRMDAVPFMWKRLGTTCQNQPEGHTLLQLLHALTRLAAPGVVFKAEAIVVARGPGALPRRRTSGTGRSASWPTTTSSWCCSGAAWPPRTPGWPRTRCAGCGRSRRPRRGSPTCAGTTTSAGRSATSTPAAVGVSGFGHRRFLNDFYCGRFPGSFARGALFQENEATGDARISGIGGLAVRHRGRPGAGGRRGAGGRDPPAGAALLGRLLLRRHPAALHGRRAGPAQRHRLPRRPRARPGQPLDAPPADGLGRRRAPDATPTTLEGRVFGWLQRLGEARRALPALRGGGECTVLDVGNDAVLAWRRRHPRSGDVRRAWPTSAGRRQTVDADTVTGFGTFERGADQRRAAGAPRGPAAPARASGSPGSPSPEPREGARGPAGLTVSTRLSTSRPRVPGQRRRRRRRPLRAQERVWRSSSRRGSDARPRPLPCRAAGPAPAPRSASRRSSTSSTR